MPSFKPYDAVRLDATTMATRARTFADECERRRTVRHFSRQDVPEAIVRDLVRAASTAPSGAHRQPWHFVAIHDPDMKRRVREAAEAEEERNYGGRLPPEWRAALEPFGTDAHKPHLEEAAWLIAVFAQNHGPPGKNYYVTESVGIAVGLLVTAIHRAGLVSVIHTPSPMNFLKELLGRPSGERACLIIALGHAVEGVQVPDLRRKDLEEVLTIVP